MKKVGQRRRARRQGEGSCTALLVSVLAMSSGCTDDRDVGSGSGGAGGAEAGRAPFDMREVARITSPFDATPDPDGHGVYIVALDPALGAGVFKVAQNGAASAPVYAGAPFVGPFGVATSNDGSTLYVSDPAWESEDGAALGQIFAVPAGGGSPAAVAGTAGMRPRSLEVLDDHGKDMIVFSGRAADGSAGVFRVAASGGTVTRLDAPGSLMDPSGIALTNAGDVYVADSRGNGVREASVLRIKDGQATEILSDVAVGFPVGLALTQDTTTLLVSGLDGATSGDLVYAVDLGSKAVNRFSGSSGIDIGQFQESAGLHRAKNVNVFAWADSRANGSGTVFLLSK